jgi:hypothetical protein
MPRNLPPKVQRPGSFADKKLTGEERHDAEC